MRELIKSIGVFCIISVILVGFGAVNWDSQQMLGVGLILVGVSYTIAACYLIAFCLEFGDPLSDELESSSVAAPSRLSNLILDHGQELWAGTALAGLANFWNVLLLRPSPLPLLIAEPRSGSALAEGSLIWGICFLTTFGVIGLLKYWVRVPIDQREKPEWHPFLKLGLVMGSIGALLTTVLGAWSMLSWVLS